MSASAVQAVWFGQSDRQALYIWLAAAALSLLVGVRKWSSAIDGRNRPWSARSRSLAVEQFAPCLVAGALMTYAMSEFAGKFAVDVAGAVGDFVQPRRIRLPAGRCPRHICVGAYYLLAGCCASRGIAGRSSVRGKMAVTFGGGQLLAAGLLYWMLESGRSRPSIR